MPDRKDRNRELRDAFVRHAIGLRRLGNGYAVSAVDSIDSTEPRLQRLIERFLSILKDKRVDLTTAASKRRLDALRRGIRDLRIAAVVDAARDLEDKFKELVISQWAWLGDAVSTITLGEIDLTVPGGGKEATELVRDSPFEGRTLRDWFADLGAADADRIYGAVVTGVAQDRSERDVLRAAIGSEKLDGTDGATHRTRLDVATLVATALTHYSSQAIDWMADENSDEFPRDVFTAVLDNRTTPICRSLDGNVYPRGEGPIPPLHHRCRSIRVPLLPGQVPDRQTYSEWLGSQSAGFQDEVLGDARGKLFRRGGLTLDRFVDMNGQEYTLEELARFNRKAFIDAGLDPDAYSG